MFNESGSNNRKYTQQSFSIGGSDKKVKRKHGTAPLSVRKALEQAIAGRGRDVVLKIAARVAPTKSRQAHCDSIRRALRKQPLNTSTVAVLKAIVSGLDNVVVAESPIEKRSRVAAALADPKFKGMNDRRIGAQIGLSASLVRNVRLGAGPKPAPLAVHAPARRGKDSDLVEAMKALAPIMAEASAAATARILAPILSGLHAPQQAPQLPAPQIVPVPEHRPKQFPQMDAPTQRKILHSMHGGYAERVARDSGVEIRRAYPMAWDISYTAFDRETSSDVRARATAQSDSTGERIKPIDLIERDGQLVRFWEIVRKTWEVQ